MSLPRAEPLSPIDAATLWPQLRRLSTEVIAIRAGENLLLSSGLAATGLANLGPLPRTVVLGVRRGLSYRGVLVVRQLAGGWGWEAVSLRIARDKDDEALVSLLGTAGMEVARRQGRTVYLRVAEGSPHERAVQRGGFTSCRSEVLYALPAWLRQQKGESPFCPPGAADRHGVFRLYCRAVPEHVRRFEAPTLQDWRSVLDSFDCSSEFVVHRGGGVAAWVGVAARECRVMVDVDGRDLVDAALDVVEARAARDGLLVLGDDQADLAHNALARGYTQLGSRLLCARRLPVLNPLKEVVAVPAESFALPHGT
jgi:hypothetical protein